MDTYRATLGFEGVDDTVSIGCGATSRLAADVYFAGATPDGMHIIDIIKVER